MAEVKTEALERFERLKGHAETIKRAISALPATIAVTTEKGPETVVETSKAVYRNGGESYTGGGDRDRTTPKSHEFTSQVRSSEGAQLMAAKYIEPSVTLKDNEANGRLKAGERRFSPVHHPDELQVTSANGAVILSATGDQAISIQPGLEETDIQKLAVFFNTARLQHEAAEAEKAAASRRAIDAAAGDTRALLSGLV